MSVPSRLRIEIVGSGEFDYQHARAVTDENFRQFALECICNFLEKPLAGAKRRIVGSDSTYVNNEYRVVRNTIAVEHSEENVAKDRVSSTVFQSAEERQSVEQKLRSLEAEKKRILENFFDSKQQVNEQIDAKSQHSVSCDLSLSCETVISDSTDSEASSLSKENEIIFESSKLRISRVRRRSSESETSQEEKELPNPKRAKHVETNIIDQNKYNYILALELLPTKMIRALEENKRSSRRASTKPTPTDPSTGKENKTDEPPGPQLRVRLPRISSTITNYSHLASGRTECKDEHCTTKNHDSEDSDKTSDRNNSSTTNIVVKNSERVSSTRRKSTRGKPSGRSIVNSNKSVDKISAKSRKSVPVPNVRRKRSVKSRENETNDDANSNTKIADDAEISGVVEKNHRNIKDNSKRVVLRLKSISDESRLKRRAYAVVHEQETELCSQDDVVCTPKKSKRLPVSRAVDENFDSDDECLATKFKSPNPNARTDVNCVSSGELFKPTTSVKKSINGEDRVTRSSRKKLSLADESSPKETVIRRIDESPKTPRTPKSAKLCRSIFRSPRVNPNAITPTRSIRNTPYKTPTTPQNQARWSLMLSEAPESLPCREKEFDTIYKFLCDKIRSKCGGFLCISGVPGTGKTATVERVLRKLRRDRKQKGLDKFQAVEINGMELIKPQEVYRQIFKQLDGRVLSVKMAQELLDERFETKKPKKREPLILVIDEFDCLLNKKHDVVYKIVEWQIQDNSQLTVLAIANTLDFFENKKIFSRLKYDMISFTAYTYQDLKEIVCNRLKGNNLFSVEAIELVARKVAAISGDARRVLNLCSQILEMTAENDGQMITIVDVNKILEKIFSDPVVPQIRKLSENLTRILRAVRDVLLRSGLPETSLYDGVWEQYKIICQLEGVTRSSMLQVCHSIRQLVGDGLLKMDDDRVTYCTKFTLNTEPDMIKLALNGKK